MSSVPTLAERRARALGDHTPTFYREPLELIRGEGAALFDASGNRYLDLFNNVPCVGHGNPRVVAAMAEQQATLNVHSRYLHGGIVEFAERLTALHGPSIESVLFSCTGTEAVEVAITMARHATGRRGLIGTNATYHGNSELVIGLARSPAQPDRYPECRSITFPQRFRPITDGGATDAELADAHLAELAATIEQLERDGVGLAAVVFCSIFANEGLPNIPEGFMARASDMVHDAGGLVIADEVQAGYCRTGRWWGYEGSGLRPDIVVTGKPMGNGLPLAATAASHALVSGFRRASRHFNTFAASPLQAAVGLAVLDEIEDRELAANAREVGRYLRTELDARLGRRPWLGDVRGDGLFIGVEMIGDPADRTPDPARAVAVVEDLKTRGFLTWNAGAFRNVLKIRPPLVLDLADAAAFIEAFDACIESLGD